MIYAQPGSNDAIIEFKKRYENYINGEWRAPKKGMYFENVTPVTGEVFCEVARSTAEDINYAIYAAHTAKKNLDENEPCRANPHFK